MRLRVCVSASALALLGGIIAAGIASAAPSHNNGLTISAIPNPVIAGEGVLVNGRLFGSGNGDQQITLYHHVSGSHTGYTRVAVTTTDPSGYFEFLRPEGLIYTNRAWYVRGPDGSRSQTVHERVMALVSIAASTTNPDTDRAVVFHGHVTPNQQFEQVLLQQRIGSSDDWRTLGRTTLDPGSNYFVAHRWRRPGSHDVRVLFRGNRRDARSSSDVVTVQVQQAQIPGFTISSSDPIVPTGGSATISGTLDKHGSSKPDPDTLVQLWGRTPDQRFQVLADGVTGGDGGYSFNRSGLTTNTIYFVATMPGTHSPHAHTARLYQGVKDAVTMQTGSSNVSSGQTVTFTGMVLPDSAGRVIALQTLGQDGDWHTIELGIVQPDSAFQFTRTIGSPGSSQFRARIASDEDNIGSASAPVKVVAAAAPASSLPQGL